MTVNLREYSLEICISNYSYPGSSIRASATAIANCVSSIWGHPRGRTAPPGRPPEAGQNHANPCSANPSTTMRSCCPASLRSCGGSSYTIPATRRRSAGETRGSRTAPKVASSGTRATLSPNQSSRGGSTKRRARTDRTAGSTRMAGACSDTTSARCAATTAATSCRAASTCCAEAAPARVRLPLLVDQRDRRHRLQALREAQSAEHRRPTRLPFRLRRDRTVRPFRRLAPLLRPRRPLLSPRAAARNSTVATRAAPHGVSSSHNDCTPANCTCATTVTG